MEITHALRSMYRDWGMKSFGGSLGFVNKLIRDCERGVKAE